MSSPTIRSPPRTCTKKRSLSPATIAATTHSSSQAKHSRLIAPTSDSSVVEDPHSLPSAVSPGPPDIEMREESDDTSTLSSTTSSDLLELYRLLHALQDLINHNGCSANAEVAEECIRSADVIEELWHSKVSLELQTAGDMEQWNRLQQQVQIVVQRARQNNNNNNNNKTSDMLSSTSAAAAVLDVTVQDVYQQATLAAEIRDDDEHQDEARLLQVHSLVNGGVHHPFHHQYHTNENNQQSCLSSAPNIVSPDLDSRPASKVLQVTVPPPQQLMKPETNKNVTTTPLSGNVVPTAAHFVKQEGSPQRRQWKKTVGTWMLLFLIMGALMHTFMTIQVALKQPKSGSATTTISLDGALPQPVSNHHHHLPLTANSNEGIDFSPLSDHPQHVVTNDNGESKGKVETTTINVVHECLLSMTGECLSVNLSSCQVESDSSTIIMQQENVETVSSFIIQEESKVDIKSPIMQQQKVEPETISKPEEEEEEVEPERTGQENVETASSFIIQEESEQQVKIESLIMQEQEQVEPENTPMQEQEEQVEPERTEQEEGDAVQDTTSLGDTVESKTASAVPEFEIITTQEEEIASASLLGDAVEPEITAKRITQGENIQVDGTALDEKVESLPQIFDLGDGQQIMDVFSGVFVEEDATSEHMYHGKPFAASDVRKAAATGDLGTLVGMLTLMPEWVNAQDSNGWNALHLVARSGREDMLRYLVQLPVCDVNLKTNGGKTALQIAETKAHAGIISILQDILNPKVAGAERQEIQMDGMMASQGLRQFSTDDIRFEAAQDGSGLSEMIAAKPEWINSQDGNGWAALHEAARGGNVFAIKLLLDAGANRNLETSLGYTAYKVSLEFNGPDHPATLLLSKTDDDS